MSSPAPHAPHRTWGAILADAAGALSDAGVALPMRDARRLLAHALDIDPSRLTLHIDAPPDVAARARFARLIEGRRSRCPVARLIGRRRFWNSDFGVGPDVLDPRPETETLVDLALAGRFERLLDLGTGSGCILLSLLAERPGARGLGTDISPAALRVAAGNAARLGLSDRATLCRADWFDGVEGRFDLVVSNPPYIPASEVSALDPEVRDHDPRQALTDGGDGLGAYRAITAGVRAHLAPRGRLLVEIGPDQAAGVTGLFRRAGLEEIAVHPDLDARDRVVSARNLA